MCLSYYIRPVCRTSGITRENTNIVLSFNLPGFRMDGHQREWEAAVVITGSNPHQRKPRCNNAKSTSLTWIWRCYNVKFTSMVLVYCGCNAVRTVSNHYLVIDQNNKAGLMVILYYNKCQLCIIEWLFIVIKPSGGINYKWMDEWKRYCH